MLARPPLQWQSSLLRAVIGNRTSGLIKISLYSGWLYLTNYGKFYVVSFAIRENINNNKCANFTVV